MIARLMKWAHIGLREEEETTDEDKLTVQFLFTNNTMEDFETFVSSVFADSVTEGGKVLNCLTDEQLDSFTRYMKMKALQQTLSRRYESERDEEDFFLD